MLTVGEQVGTTLWKTFWHFFFFFLFQLKSKVCPSYESVILPLFIFLGWGMKIDRLYSYTEAHKKNIDHNKGDTREYMKYYFMHAFY